MSNIYCNLIPPCNKVAEEILLGSILLHPEKFNNIFKEIKVEYFFIESNQIIYRNLISIKNKKEINIINLVHTLKSTKTLAIIGGTKKIIQIVKKSQVFISSVNITFYIYKLISNLRHNYHKRLLIQYGYNIIQLAYIHNLSSEEIYIKASKYINYISEQRKIKKLDNFHHLVSDLIKNITENKLSKNRPFVISGFEKLDKMTQGLPNGDLIVIAGRPSTGKTSFAINIIYNLIKLQNTLTDIIIFSLEMTKIQIIYKLISIGSCLSINEIITGQINLYQWKTIQSICNKLLKSQLYINDSSNVHIDNIKLISELAIKKTNHTAIVIIDYLQLIKTIHFNADNRQQELTYITRELKIMAQNLFLPVLILSQLNRSIEKRVSKRPILSDLKESGCLGLKLGINIDYKNKLKVKQILNYKTQICLQYFTGKTKDSILDKKRIDDYIYYIYLLTNYIFSLFTKSILQVTDNHKLLIKHYWYCQNQIEEKKEIVIINKKKITEVALIKNINFAHYSLVYDISKNRYLNLISNHLIIHNSIEQDADIVMMLYDNNVNIEQNSKSKILEMIISKNRNGPTGTFQLIFYKKNTVFKSTKNYDMVSFSVD